MNQPILPQEITIDFRRYVAAIQAWLWLIVLVAMLSGVGAYFLSSRQTPIYRATTSVLINEAPLNKATDYTAVITSQSLIKTYAQLMKKSPVLNGVIQELGLNMTAGELGGAITITPVVETQIIEVSVEDSNPERAALIANTLVEVFSQQILETQSQRYAASKQSLQEQMSELEIQMAGLQDELAKERDRDARDRLEARIGQNEESYNNLAYSYEQVRLTEAQTISSTVPVDEAAVPGAPVRPRTMTNVALAAMAGAVLALCGALLIEMLDDSIKDPEDITARFHLPILTLVLQHSADAEVPVAQSAPRSPISEAFRVLRTNLQYAGPNKPIRRLLVTSPTPSDGKTTVAANLAVVVAQGGQKVILVDGDLHRPRVHKALNTNNRFGLSTLFTRTGFQPRDLLQPTRVKDLRVMGSGPIPDNPSELLGSQRMGEILDRLNAESDMVIIDSPPTLSVTDTAVLAPQVDGILLVVKPDTCNLTVLKQTIEQLQRVGGNVVGIVLNQIKARHSRYRYYYKNYAYSQIYQDHYAGHHDNGHRKNGKLPLGEGEISAEIGPRDVQADDFGDSSTAKV